MTDIDDIDLRIRKSPLDSSPSLLKFKKTIEFDSIKSEIIGIEYSNRIFISITTSGKFGAVLSAKVEKTSASPIEDSVYTVRNLFGQSEPLLEVFARSLVEKLNNSSKPLLLAVGLTRHHLNKATLFKSYEKEIVAIFKQQQ
jgi:hypothetical protein